MGFQETLVFNNGYQFTSQIFSDSYRRNDTVHIRCPPDHPQPNRQAEQFMDMFNVAALKAMVKGTRADVTRHYLHVYRRTPNSSVP